MSDGDVRQLEHGAQETYFLYLSGTNENKTFSLEEPLRNVISVEVNSALIPRTEYTIEPDRDALVFRFNNGTWSTIHLDHRDYDADDLAMELTSKLVLNADSITVTNNIGKGIFEFTSSTDFELDMINSTCQRVVGFPHGSRWRSIDDWVYAPNRYNLMGTEVILLESDLDNQLNHAKVNSVGAPFAKFYVSDSTKSQFVQHIHYEQPPRPFFPIGKLSKLSIKFVRGHKEPGSEMRQLYNFHGIHYYIHVVVKCVNLGKDWNKVGEYISKSPIVFQKEEHYHNGREKKKEKDESVLTWKHKAGLAVAGVGIGYVGYQYYLKPKMTFNTDLEI